MLFRKFILLTATLMFVCTFAVAQTQPSPPPQASAPAADAEAAKKKKELDERVIQMLDQSVADANGLRLPQNRAVVYAMAGDLYWKYDDKRSRELFRNAANEIITFNAEAERETMALTVEGITDAISSMLDLSDPRADVVNLISRHDADLALEILLQTRSAKLADPMPKAAASPDAQPNTGAMCPHMNTSRLT